jgi:trehalose 2-sulfotransferase
MGCYPVNDANPSLDFPTVESVGQMYVIASSARTGSTLLTRTLGQTGVAGRPAEYFNTGTVDEFRARFGDQTLVPYLRRLMRIRTSPNGLFALKIHWIQHQRSFLQAGVDPATAISPPPRWIWVRRADKLRQAISVTRARQSGSWRSEDRATAEPVYNSGEIRRDLDAAIASDASWQRYFQERDIAPLELWFREVVTDLDGTVRQVLRHIGADPTVQIPPASMHRQSDGRSDAWAERFKQEAQSRGQTLPAAWGVSR